MKTDIDGVRLVHRTATARGYTVGEQHHFCRHPDLVVAEARALRARGWTHAAIGRRLGIPRSTVQGWCGLRRRRPHDRIVVVVTRKTDN